MRDPVKFNDTHSVEHRQQKLHRLRKGQSYVYHRGTWSTCDGRIKGTVNHLRDSGEITSAQRRVGAFEYDFIAQGLIED